MKNKLEILAPAGSEEKMKYAIHYGADAVYAGVPDFSLRARINAFNLESLKKGVTYAHKLDKKFYVTLNIYAHNQLFKKLEKHLKELRKIDMDGIIVSDPGVLDLVKEYLPKVEIHLSTQANATNWRAVKFWAKQGVKRVILAREVTLPEIKEIHRRVPAVELEYFVHGAMCMSYSGRCILSKWMTGRSANLGDCAQPCRWKYHSQTKTNSEKKELYIENNEKKSLVKTMTVEDYQKEFALDLEEDNNGTYFFNSKDLNLLAYLQELINVGVTSFKIEGRNKSVYYLAVVVRAYRNVLKSLKVTLTGCSNRNIIFARLSHSDDSSQKQHPNCYSQNYKKILNKEQQNLNDLVQRGYTTGFLLGQEPEHNFEKSHNKSNWEFVGEVLKKINYKENHKEDDLIKIKVHNAIYADDKIEIIDKQGNHSVKILAIYQKDLTARQGLAVVKSAHGGHQGFYYLKVDKKNIQPMALLRKRVKKV